MPGTRSTGNHSDGKYTPLTDTILELAARADAGQKLGMQALEFTMGLAKRLGVSLDLEGAAQAMENPFATIHLDPEAKQIERQSRKITAGVLREFAKKQHER